MGANVEIFNPPPKEGGMLGSGVVIINTPFFATEEIDDFTKAFR